MADQIPPARLLVARHGDAVYSVGRGRLTAEGGALSATGRDQVRRMAEGLAGEGVSLVYSSTLERAEESARIAADVLGLEHRVVGGIQEYEVGDDEGRAYSDPAVQELFAQWAAGNLAAGFPGGESGNHIVERYREALTDIAAQARGRTALVISHGGVMALALPRLSENVRDDLAHKQFLPNAVPATVVADGSTFRIDSWPGSEDKQVV